MEKIATKTFLWCIETEPNTQVNKEVEGKNQVGSRFYA